jgi:hypothetical protein
MKGRESWAVTFTLPSEASGVHARARSNTNIHPNPRKGEMHARLLFSLKLSEAMLEITES